MYIESTFVGLGSRLPIEVQQSKVPLRAVRVQVTAARFVVIRRWIPPKGVEV